jgi:hypothetical protein
MVRICLAIAVPCLLLAGAAWADEDPASKDAGSLDAGKSLNLFLTREEMRALTNRYAWIPQGGEEYEGDPGDDPNEVTVRAPGPRLPMRDPSQDVPGGIAAPFWALAHPKDAWRIFLPIPPKPDRR